MPSMRLVLQNTSQDQVFDPFRHGSSLLDRGHAVQPSSGYGRAALLPECP